MTLPFGAFNGDMARMANFGQWAGYFPTYTMTLNPNANKTPAFTGTWEDFQDSNGTGISRRTSRQFCLPDCRLKSSGQDLM